MRKKIKECVLCQKPKEAIEYPETDRGSGKAEYCFHCQEKYKDHVFLMNKALRVVDAVPQEIADNLTVSELVEFKKGKYILKNEVEYNDKTKQQTETLSEEQTNVLGIGKYGEKRATINKKRANQLVKEGAALWEGRNIRFLFSGKELQESIVKRDEGICYFCGEKGDRIAFKIPRTEGGLLSPVNSVCCCKNCKETEGEDLYYSRWLSVDVLMGEKRDIKNKHYMIDDKEQTTFTITKETADKLVEEKMAIRIDPEKVKIKFSKKEFSKFILERDKYTCYYCKRYGDTIDHVIAKTNGGLTTPKNCVCACAKCNSRKSDRDILEFQNNK